MSKRGWFLESYRHSLSSRGVSTSRTLNRKWRLSQKKNPTLFRYWDEKGQEDMLPGGLADNMSDSAFDSDELEQGMKVEMEHTSDPRVAREIAKDHIYETGYTGVDGKIHSDYYLKLKEVEGT